jgi:ferrous iron transport protein A
MSGDFHSLNEVPVGAAVIVKEVNLPPETRTRLMELGLVAGTAVEVVRFAPLGDPVEIKFRGSHLTLRRQEAGLIRVGLK